MLPFLSMMAPPWQGPSCSPPGFFSKKLGTRVYFSSLESLAKFCADASAKAQSSASVICLMVAWIVASLGRAQPEKLCWEVGRIVRWFRWVAWLVRLVRMNLDFLIWTMAGLQLFAKVFLLLIRFWFVFDPLLRRF